MPSDASVATTMPSSMGRFTKERMRSSTMEFFLSRASAKSSAKTGATVLNLRTFLNSSGCSRTSAPMLLTEVYNPTVWSVLRSATSRNQEVASFPTSTSRQTSARHSPRADSVTTASFVLERMA